MHDARTRAQEHPRSAHRDRWGYRFELCEERGRPRVGPLPRPRRDRARVSASAPGAAQRLDLGARTQAVYGELLDALGKTRYPDAWGVTMRAMTLHLSHSALPR